MCGAQRASPTLSLTDSPSIVHIRLNRSTEPLTIFRLFDSGALKNNYASERVTAWCREHFPRTIGDTASGRVCSPIASICTASSKTLSSVGVDVFDDIVNKSMSLDFRILPFQSNVGYDVILAIDTLIKHQLLWTTFRHRFTTQPLQSICLARISALQSICLARISGHLIDSEGMHFTRTKLDSIARFEEPKTMFEVKHFLGLANCFRNHVPKKRFCCRS
jgi:hypothetical protein